MYSKQENSENLALYQYREDEEQNVLNRVYNNKILYIISKDTNTPISVHCSDIFLKDIEQTYSVEIPKGVVDINYRNLMHIKYNERQKQQIKNLNTNGIKLFLDDDVREYIEYQYSMCNDLDELNILRKDNSLEGMIL